MSRGMPRAAPTRCLGPELSAYADRALVPEELHAWDRHLVACLGCRHAVEEERQVLAALRSPAAPDLPSGLRAMLLSLETGAPPPPPAAPAGSRRDPLEPLPVVGRDTPALHRSAVRATVFAGLAAGASAAAAWSIAVTGSPLTPIQPTPSPAVQRTRPPVSSFVNAQLTSGLAPFGAATPATLSPARTAVNGAEGRSAQSTP